MKLSSLVVPQPTECAESIFLRVERVLGRDDFLLLARTQVAKTFKGAMKTAILRRNLQVLSALLEMPLDVLSARHTLVPLQQFLQWNPPDQFACSPYVLPACAAVKWRFCPKCRGEDLTYHGFSFYRRHHQVIGVSTCRKHHHTQLLEVPSEHRAALPSDEGFEKLAHVLCRDQSRSERRDWYCQLVEDILDSVRPCRRTPVVCRIKQLARLRHIPGDGHRRNQYGMLFEWIEKRNDPDAQFAASVIEDCLGRFLGNDLDRKMSRSTVPPVLCLLAAVMAASDDKQAAWAMFPDKCPDEIKHWENDALGPLIHEVDTHKLSQKQTAALRQLAGGMDSAEVQRTGPASIS